MTDEGRQQLATLDGWLDDAAAEMIDLQRGLCAHPAIGPGSGGKGEAEKAEWLRQQLEGWGFPPPDAYPAPCPDVPDGERPNHVYRLAGSGDGPTHAVPRGMATARCRLNRQTRDYREDRGDEKRDLARPGGSCRSSPSPPSGTGCQGYGGKTAGAGSLGF